MGTWNSFALAVTAALLVMTFEQAHAVGVAPLAAEMAAKRTWVKQHLLGGSANDRRPVPESGVGASMPASLPPRTGNPPFAFTYGGKSSDSLLASWPTNVETSALDSARTMTTRIWTDPATGLEVRCSAVEYSDFPAVEWTVSFKNGGHLDTPILEGIQGLDAAFQRRAGGEFVLRGNKGDFYAAEGYEPTEHTLGPNASLQFAPDGGRPTNGPGGWPYYNVQMPGGGLIAAVGWPGQWASRFVRDGERSLRITAGQERTHLALKPGEMIRAPLIALLFWKGADPVRAQNLWRRWFMAHNIPRINGAPPAPMLQIQVCLRFEDGEQTLWDEVRRYTAADVPFDLCWRDAGWYPCAGEWPRTGTWELDAKRFPHGFRPFSDWIHGQGKKFIVWFEPERVGDKQSWLSVNHPDWLLDGTLLNLGNPDAWKWLVEHVDGIIRAQGIDYYRQDFNIDPLRYWRQHDAPDRQGITENLHVQGYLAYWDELRRRHPGLLIDSCASGGRRNDLETLRRAVPLLRSDYQFGPETSVGNQGHTYGISSWIPYYGSGTYAVDKYNARSFYMPCFGTGGVQDLKETKRDYEECSQVAPFMLGDFYPLTPYGLQADRWIAWQFDRPDLGAGVIQAFRRDKCPTAAESLRVAGLDPDATYILTDFDRGALPSMTGREMMERGIAVEIPSQPGAVVVTYRRAR